MSYTDFTIDAYNEKAEEISAKFQNMDARIDDINRAASLLDKKVKLSILELGSGDGRDATEIIKKFDSYIGVEPSIGLLRIARLSLPNAVFIQATAQEFDFPSEVDAIFAFASLLHINKEDMKVVFDKAYNSLAIGGIFYISLKEASDYQAVITDDVWGRRQFYHYSKENIQDIAGNRFKTVYIDHQIINDTKWLTIALKK